MSRLRVLVMAAFSLGALGVRTASADVVYATNFSAPVGAEWSNTSRATSNGETFLGSSANGFGAGTVTLTLSGLAPHDSVTLDFDLYIIQSWDGNGPNGGGADNYRLEGDGSTVLFTNFANFDAGNTQAYPNQLPPNGPGGAFAPKTGAFELDHLGFGTGDFGDTTYRFSFTFAHTASSLVLAFTSLQNQAPGDEGWGLDNVTVQISPVPEPTSLALIALGGAGLAFVARRRRPRPAA